MYSNKKLKKLAHIASENDKIPEDITEFVLKRLSKKELKDFLYFYKAELEKKRVYVYAAVKLSVKELTDLKSLYKNKEILPIIDGSLGGGLRIKEDDMVVDFTLKNYINETIEKLKS